MKNVIILLFEAVKFIDRFPQWIIEFEDKLKSLAIKNDFEIYYLKINTAALDTKRTDSIERIVPYSPGNNSITLIDKPVYYFRQKKSLLKCLKKNIPPNKKNKYFFISIGHGRGFGFFSERKDVVTTKNKISNENLFDILWNYELAEIFKIYKCKLALFNNCNVSLYDNILHFKSNVNYLIGTENFLSIQMFDATLILEAIIDNVFRLDSTDDSEKDRFAEVVLQNYMISMLTSVSSESLNVDNASLYLIKVSKITELQILLEKILVYFKSNFKKLSAILIKTRKFYTPIGSDLTSIDLLYYFRTLLFECRDCSVLSKYLNSFLLKFEEFLIGGISLKTAEKLAGVAIFFPQIDSTFGDDIYFKAYKRYIDKTNFFADWYELLEMIQKTIQKK